MFGLTRFTGMTFVVNAVVDDDVLYAVADADDTGGKEYREDGGVFGSELVVAEAGRDAVESTERRGCTTG